MGGLAKRGGLKDISFQREARMSRDRSCFESLEDRRLLSVTVPAGYVEIAHVTPDSYMLDSPPLGVALKAGHNYFFKATGKHTLAAGPRYADAAGYQQTVNGSYTAGTHLHVYGEGTDNLFTWTTTPASDNEYGKLFTPTHDYESPVAHITDSNRFDNNGTLDLLVYEQVVLNSFTGTQSDD
jgi:hypothetical protein